MEKNLLSKKIEALFNLTLGYSIIDEEEISTDGKTFWTVDGDFLVLTEEEAEEMVVDYIEQSASYFNADFLAQMTELPEEIFPHLVDQNEAVARLIEKTCGLDEFVAEAIRWDGRGHFLSSYDGEELEVEVDGQWFYIYRTN